MRKHSKKLAALLAITVTGALALTGCGGASAEEELSDEPMTLQYAIWDKNQEPAMNEIVEAFRVEHPNVTIKLQNSGDKYYEKLQTAMAGGGGPDVFWINGPNFPLYASNGQLEPLDVTTEDYPDSLVDLYSFDGKIYGAPKDYDTIGVWYNKEIFDAAGVAYPQEGWTWDDYMEIATQLTDPAQGIWGSAAKLNDQSGYYNTVPQAGGFVINSEGTETGWGSPEALAGVEFWVDQIKEGLSPTQEQMTDTSVGDLFTSGKIAMYWDGSWNATLFSQNEQIADKLDVAPLPAGPKGNMSVVHGIANVVNAASENKSMAKAFALFASGEQAAKILAESGAVIPAFQGNQQTWVDAVPQYNLQSFLDAVDTAVPYPVSRNTSAWGSIQSDVLTQVWALTLPPAEGLQQLAEKMQAQLDKDQE
ncbi:ABC transporter substrate-binding protein [Tessaracoccus sp.]